jgi:hypothetical protein
MNGCIYVGGNGKAIPVTGREGPWGCETSRLAYFLYSLLTDGGEVRMILNYSERNRMRGREVDSSGSG